MAWSYEQAWFAALRARQRRERWFWFEWLPLDAEWSELTENGNDVY